VSYHSAFKELPGKSLPKKVSLFPYNTPLKKRIQKLKGRNPQGKEKRDNNREILKELLNSEDR
jgi:hypothetical protein